uniref:DUF5857 domain-containing protein n=1 Tax=Marseillevirus LCMAC102 TaxID=2506603 RepID=A0A481YUH0_9VIRU|nr:MAG: hypothetical protein LCMAC102_03260 [Marseillevirus LCMAC102]
MSKWIDWSDKKHHTIVSLGSVGKILSSNKDKIAHTKYLNLEGDFNTSWHLDKDGSLVSTSKYYGDKKPAGCLNVTLAGNKIIEECKGGKPTLWAYDQKQGFLIGKNLGEPAYYLCADETGLYTISETGLYPPDNSCKWIDYSEAVKCCTETFPPSDVDEYCSPNYNPSSQITACPVLMVDKCVGDWTSLECKAYLSSFKNQENARKTVQMAVRNYINSKDPPDFNPQRDSNDPFYTSTMPNLCQTVVGACDDVLYQYCAQFTRENIDNNKTLQKLCGCHLSDGNPPPNAGLNLKNVSFQPNQYPYPGIDSWCDPICRFSGTIEEAYQSNGMWNPRECKSTTCILDNITVNEVNSCGGFNIDMVCGGCKGKTAGCSSCYISDVTANIINSCGKINLKQHCGSCYIFDQDNPAAAKKVSCGTLSPQPEPPSPDEGWISRLKRWFDEGDNKLYVGISVLVISLLIIVTIIIIVIGRKRKEKKKMLEFKGVS